MCVPSNDRADQPRRERAFACSRTFLTRRHPQVHPDRAQGGTSRIPVPRRSSPWLETRVTGTCPERALPASMVDGVQSQHGGHSSPEIHARRQPPPGFWNGKSLFLASPGRLAIAQLAPLLRQGLVVRGSSPSPIAKDRARFGWDPHCHPRDPRGGRLRNNVGRTSPRQMSAGGTRLQREGVARCQCRSRQGFRFDAPQIRKHLEASI